jgi:hypothetical protein
VTFLFDVDGTLVPHDLEKPLEWDARVVAGIQSLRHAGHTVRIWTARGAKEFGGADSPLFQEAVAWVHDKFPDMEVLPKPLADFYVDDRAIAIGAKPFGVGLDWVFKTYGADA